MAHYFNSSLIILRIFVHALRLRLCGLMRSRRPPPPPPPPPAAAAVLAVLSALALVCASFGPSRNHPGAFLEPSWRHLGPSEACLGHVLDHPGPVLGHFRGVCAVLGLSWAILALSWACLGPSWHPLGPSRRHLEHSGQDPRRVLIDDYVSVCCYKTE